MTRRTGGERSGVPSGHRRYRGRVAGHRPAPPTGTVTFLFTDVEGSTERWQHDEAGMAARLERHDEVMRRCIADGDGHVFSIAGDSFGAAFASVESAVNVAVAMQSELQDAVLPVRIGLHVGESQERDGNYFGTTVNRAARIMSIGHGGQILVSGTVRELAPGHGGLEFTDLGAYRLKDLDGLQQIWQVHAEGLRSDFPPLRAGGSAGNLTTPATSILGRESETELGVRLLDERRLVTITGPSGIGKSRLAHEIGARLVPKAADGVWFVDLTAVRDRDGLEAAIVASLDLPAVEAEAVAPLLAARDMVVVLDACEQAPDDVADLVEAVIAAGDRARFLATSLAPLEVPGEQLVPLLGLDADGTGFDLFVERARLTEPRFDPHADDDHAVRSICRRLDGVPLAIEMAAARVGMLAPTAIDERLAERFDLLIGTRRSSDRHRTLRATIEWTVSMLESDARDVLEALAVFCGPFTLEAAEHVAGSASATSILDVVSDLRARSLVVVAEGPSGSSLRLPESVRLFGLDRLEQAGALDEVRDRHLDHYAAWAEARKAWHVAPLRDDHAEVAFVRGDLEAAFERAVESGATDSAHQLVLGVANSLCFISPPSTDRLLTTLEGWDGSVDPTLVERRELARARYHQVTGAFFDVVERLERLVDSAEEPVRPAAMNLLANTLAGDLARARRLAEEAREAFVVAGDGVGVYDVDVTLSALDLYECDAAAALGRDLDRSRSSLHGHYNQLGALALAGDHVALRHELELLDSRDLRLTYDYQEPMLMALADALAGDADAARASLREAVRRVRRTPVPLCAEECALAAAFVARQLGDLRDAAQRLGAFRSSGPAPYRTAPAIGLFRTLRRQLAEDLGDEFTEAWNAGTRRSIDAVLHDVLPAGEGER